MIANGIKNKIFNDETIIIGKFNFFKRAGSCAIVTYFALEVAKN